ncbi:hypothetical protein ACHAPJ_005144 [Fusarium lateritium]
MTCPDALDSFVLEQEVSKDENDAEGSLFVLKNELVDEEYEEDEEDNYGNLDEYLPLDPAVSR